MHNAHVYGMAQCIQCIRCLRLRSILQHYFVFIFHVLVALSFTQTIKQKPKKKNQNLSPNAIIYYIGTAHPTHVKFMFKFHSMVSALRAVLCLY